MHGSCAYKVYRVGINRTRSIECSIQPRKHLQLNIHNRVIFRVKLYPLGKLEKRYRWLEIGRERSKRCVTCILVAMHLYHRIYTISCCPYRLALPRFECFGNSPSRNMTMCVYVWRAQKTISVSHFLSKITFLVKIFSSRSRLVAIAIIILERVNCSVDWRFLTTKRYLHRVVWF